MADRHVVGICLHRPDHGGGNHQHLREIPQQSEGDLLVFPSYCRHEVTQHNNNTNRIVVAGNIKLLEHTPT